MSEAVRLVVDYGFQELKLHRIEAGVMPHNIGSIRVLEKVGFEARQTPPAAIIRSFQTPPENTIPLGF
jgi:RimJ/RimL family protein N-acetyltransferase